MADFSSNSASVPLSPSTIPTTNPRTSLPQSQGSSVTVAPLDGIAQAVSMIPSVTMSSPDGPSYLQVSPPTGHTPGKSVSVSSNAGTSANILRPPNPSMALDTPEQTSNSLGVHIFVHRPDTPASAPSSQALILPRSPVSPHRAKPRRGVWDELSSECSETGSVESGSNLIGGSGAHVCTVRAHADRGFHRHPMLNDEPGPEGCSTDADSLKTESDNVIAETESAAGSTMTEPGSSARSDSISDCSNSDVEIYLETHGLDDSAMRMNCVGQQSFTETDYSRRLGAESPVLPPSIPRAGDEASQDASPQQPVRVEREDTEGWVTSSVQPLANQQQQKHIDSLSYKGMTPSAVQRGESVKVQPEGQKSGNYGTLTWPTDEKRHGQDATTPSHHPVGQPSSDEARVVQGPRPTSDLKPTSADFKPRLVIEPKPPLPEFKPAGVELNPTHIAFMPSQSSTNRVLSSTVRTTSSQRDVDNSFQSNRALPDHGFQLQNRVRPDGTVYLDYLQPVAARDDIHSESSLEKHLQVVEDLDQQAPFDDANRTPNVYINGLPPHCPEDQLYALAAPFGEVKSVRTFTRHVRDSESGYGFVLFEDVESAERCILSLRKYRNLHPTFSKQIHKIPGTIYAQTFSHTPSESMTSLSSWDSRRDETDGFKRRMENLQDPTSTNLYMEGLPLSIDEPTLAALVSPHRISSSRFFQTRLSHPPRIIAFVRLETRVGAEEIIERLHGRMRAERAVKEGDNAASRLTIAQAALLNLRGQELRQTAKINTLPVIGERRRQAVSDYPYDDLSSNSIQLPAPRPVFEVDYSIAPERSIPAQRMQSPLALTHMQQYNRPAPRSVDPSMAILLDNLRNNNPSFRGPNTGHYDVYPQQHNIALQNQQYIPDEYTVRPPAHAKSGYTATEEYIMRAHVESRRRPAPLDLALQARNRQEAELEAATANIATGVRGYRTRAAAINLDRKGQPTTLAEIEPALIMNENEFHATATRGHDDHSQALAQNIGEQDPDVTVRGTSKEYQRGNNQIARQSSRTFHTPVLPPQAQFNSTTVIDQHHNQHVRSTTFPHRPTPSQHQRHQQHNSMSVPSTGQRTPQHAATAVMGQSNLSHDKNDYQETLEKQTLRREVGNKLHSKLQHGSSVASHHQNSYDMDNQPSPSLISPTLTYSSQTPSTLSPATPFFGSFNSQNEGFDRNNGLDVKKMRAGGH
ncbi:hypothetical protein D9756_009432 [Leucocoprinus leucothites]|uniref:RRM domain-containing protein n=1 Tax=Leucocoprinus leucothites TaxID=201217 RepID=A0A8H5CXM1_9AGAR|nr:hypothetical protein D9756_009432 [Leucoagaricus leucothites]